MRNNKDKQEKKYEADVIELIRWNLIFDFYLEFDQQKLILYKQIFEFSK